jgi:tRNA (guanine37-N1)-methyltransferase
MRFDIVTIFPGLFAGIFEHGIVRRAQAEGLVTVETHDLRNFTHDRHRTVDDRPFGGGEGMVLKPEPLAEALSALGIKPKAALKAELPNATAGPSTPVAAATSTQDDNLLGMRTFDSASQGLVARGWKLVA